MSPIKSILFVHTFAGLVGSLLVVFLCKWLLDGRSRSDVTGLTWFLKCGLGRVARWHRHPGLFPRI